MTMASQSQDTKIVEFFGAPPLRQPVLLQLVWLDYLSPNLNLPLQTPSQHNPKMQHDRPVWHTLQASWCSLTQACCKGLCQLRVYSYEDKTSQWEL